MQVERGRVKELLVKYQNPVAIYHVKILARMDQAIKTLRGLSEEELQGYQPLSNELLQLEYGGDIHQVANLVEMLVKSGVRVIGFEKVNKDIQTIYNEILSEQLQEWLKLQGCCVGRMNARKLGNTYPPYMKSL